jgi:hypothetical protein
MSKIRFCIICGRYCIKRHHIISSGINTFKNKISICDLCHKKLHRGLVKIRASRLPLENLHYLKGNRTSVNRLPDFIDWNN